jgi:hypothetical protein
MFSDLFKTAANTGPKDQHHQANMMFGNGVGGNMAPGMQGHFNQNFGGQPHTQQQQ